MEQNGFLTAENFLKEARRAASPLRAREMLRFFKTGPGEYAENDRFLGLSNPVCRGLIRPWENMPWLEVEKLLQNPWHEIRLCALLIGVIRFRRGDLSQKRRILETYAACAAEKINNWDLVDLSAPGIPGEAEICFSGGILARFAAGNSLWENRIAVVGSLTLIRRGNFTLTLELVRKFSSHPHDLMHKACGWMLREVGKRDSELLRLFLRQYGETIPRTTLRYAIERFSPAERECFLKRPLSNPVRSPAGR